jgi:hypothetical protein
MSVREGNGSHIECAQLDEVVLVSGGRCRPQPRNLPLGNTSLPILHNSTSTSNTIVLGGRMSAPAAEDTVDVEALINRQNVGLARSKRILNSWLPAKCEHEAAAEEEEDDADLVPMAEPAGLGSKVAYEEYEGGDGISLPSKKLSSNDKLLEQIIGSKAAHARKKQRMEDASSKNVNGHSMSKQYASRTKQEQAKEYQSEDEDEGGRAATIASRRRDIPQDNVESQTEPQDKGGSDAEDADESTQRLKASTNTISSKPEDNSWKRKKGSYLDEILAQKSRKKKKTQHKI